MRRHPNFMFTFRELTPVSHSVLIVSEMLNVKTHAFNQEKALVGTYSAIVNSSRNLREGLFEALAWILQRDSPHSTKHASKHLGGQLCK